jgi:hypothetical protein
MRWLRWVPLLGVLTLAAPGASAQSGQIIFFGSGGQPTQASTVTDIPAQTTGQVEISFHGDAGTGCLSQGLCGYSGTVVMRPGASADVQVSGVRSHGRIAYEVALDLAPPGTVTAAHVTRAGGGVCADAEQPSIVLSGTVRSGEVSIPLFQSNGGFLATECAGPLDGDLGAAGPQVSLPVGILLRGHRSLDLSGTRSFAAGGFAGTVTSSLKIALGRPVHQRTSPALPSGIKRTRDREVIETLGVVTARGTTSLAVNGDPSTCQFVDSCGLRGSLAGTIDLTGATGVLSVIGPATRPYRDFLAALGLDGNGDARGLEVGGGIDWVNGGSVQSSLSQGTACNAQGPLGPGAVILTESGRRLKAQYVAPGLQRTRCPGPALTPDDELASGSTALGPRGGRRFTLRLSGSGAIAADGYTVSQDTSLALTITRGPVKQTTLTRPG